MALITDPDIRTKEEIINQKTHEWLDAQDYCCSCHNHPPCSWCVGGYSLPLDEFVQLAIEEELGPQDSKWYMKDEETPNTHADYDRAMKDLF